MSREWLASVWAGLSFAVLVVSWGAGHPALEAEGREGDGYFYGLPLREEPYTEKDLVGRVVSKVAMLGRDAVLPDEYRVKPPHGKGAFKYPERNDRLFMTISLKPRILYFPRLVTDEECELIIAMATKGLFRSRVAQKGLGKDAKSHVRTSKGTWLDLPKTGPLGMLRSRLTKLVGLEWHEKLQVLRYEKGEHYNAHNDYFDPALYGEQHSNRAITFFLYLSAPQSGGQTTFPRAGGLPLPFNYQNASCTTGAQVTPTKGAAVAFYNMRPDYTLDPFSLHGGCDVTGGEKWAAPLWFRIATPHGYGILK